MGASHSPIIYVEMIGGWWHSLDLPRDARGPVLPGANYSGQIIASSNEVTFNCSSSGNLPKMAFIRTLELLLLAKITAST